MSNIIEKFLTHPTLVTKPPVLVDVGASGDVHRSWRLISKYSTCIAFDADTRDFKVSEQNDKDYRKLFRINRVVSCKSQEDMSFNLQSLHCSSALEPNNKALEPWAFRDLFYKVNITKIPTITLNEALDQCKVNYIDWYKTDSGVRI